MNYFLVGQEEYLKHQFIERLKKSIPGKKNGFQPDFETFRAGQSSIREIFDSFNTLPFISANKITIIKDVDKFSKGEKETLLKSLKSLRPAGGAILVLTSSSAKGNDFIRAVSGFAKVVRCQRLRREELNHWIRKEFAFHNKKISPSVAEFMGELAGESLFSLKNEIEKISSFLGNKNTVTEEDIEKLLGRSAYRTGFELVDLVLEKKLGKILSSLDNLLIREKPHQVLYLLARQFRSLIKIKNFPEVTSAEEISRRLGMNRYFVKKTQSRARRFGQSGLNKNLAAILEADLSIKRGKLFPRDALERALVALCR